MLLRVSSRLGVARIKVPLDASVETLKSSVRPFKIEAQCQVASKDQKLVVRAAGGNQVLSPDSSPLKQFGIVNGDMIFLESPETQMTAKETQEVLKDAQVAAASFKGDRLGGHSQAHSSSGNYPGKDIKEDEIDLVLRSQDGWTKREKSTLCNHPAAGSCLNCMAIPPWSVQNHKEFDHFNIKHIAFHAWLREKDYLSPNNPVYLEDPTWRVDDVKSMDIKKTTFTVVLERQRYRHVDRIQFDNAAMLDKFIGAWRSTGKQRCGYLYGKYVVDPAGIPLGICATVCAIYEPPQKGNAEEVVLLKDTNDTAVDALAAHLGLERVGFVWTALRVDQNRKIIPDRDFSKYVLTSQECIRMCGLQNKYPNKCRQSNTGNFGSKFVSVLLYGNEEGNIEVAAYQMSNQVARLVRDGAVRASKEQPGVLRVRESSDTTIYPVVMYSHKNEYGYDVQTKADPTFPSDFGIVSVNHSFPKDSNQQLFKFTEFPIENRMPNVPNPSSVQQVLGSKLGASYVSCFSDFHLLLYLNSQLPDLVVSTLSKVVTNPGTVQESQIKPTVDSYLKKNVTSSSSSQPNTSSSSSSNAGAGNAKPGSAANLPPKGMAIVQQLVGMGYDEKAAREAVWATNMTNVDAALNFLLDS